jgi:hypothetical protein
MGVIRCGPLAGRKPVLLIVAIHQLTTHKQSLLDLFNLLIEKTKSKRGYSTTGGILSHLLSTLTGTYPLDTRFVNSEEWDSPGQNQSLESLEIIF